MIATRNRRADLARTCAVLEMLRPQPSEVLICADGCTDGTIEFLRTFHPKFRVLKHEPARGSIASRDAMLRASTADLVLSLDDDSHPLEPDFLAHAVALFTAHPRLAVADFAQRSDEHPASLEAADFAPAGPRGSYSSAGAVLRRTVYLELGGYEPFFFHAYEEPDFAVRCLAAGYEVRFEPGATIRHHYTGTQRNELRTHQFHARNELWSVFLRCPLLWLVPVAGFRVMRHFGFALSRGYRWALREPVWWWRCLRGLPTCLKRRRALRWKAYYAWMPLLRAPG
jgi:GT2 family glycosyltransferase